MANGLLDFISTPAGMGLLSGVASYAMNARKGAPINNLGRGLAGGLAGYQAGQQNIASEQNAAQDAEYRRIQQEIARQQLEISKARLDAEKDPKSKQTSEMANWQFAQGLPEEQRAQFLGKGGGMPSTVQEWEYFAKLPPEQRQQFLEMKRATKWLDMGGYQAPVLPGNNIGPATPKTMSPDAARSAGQRDREQDYTLPKPNAQPSGVYQLKDPEGTVHTFPNKETADRFRKAAGF